MRTSLWAATSLAQAEHAVYLLRDILESAGEHALVGLDGKGAIVLWSEGARRLFGYEGDEVFGISWTVFHPADAIYAGTPHDVLAKAEIDGRWAGTLSLRRKNDQLFQAHVGASPHAPLGALASGFLLWITDLSERQRTEAQLRQAQKMEAVGRLAAGVAHDFNNILTIILGYSELLLRHLGQDPSSRPLVDEIIRATERGGGLTQQLLAFSRKQLLCPRVLNINAIVAETERMLRRLIGEDIDLATVTAADLWPVKVDPGQIEQVIMNLALNARDAMPRGGKLTLETANVDVEEPGGRQSSPAAQTARCLTSRGEAAGLLHSASMMPGSYVMLAVTDTGEGMDAETQAHLFEPFFTTKEAGKGTGLGLATVYGIVKQSGGWIWVYSEHGRGTTVKVYLPRRQDNPRPLPQRPSISGVTGGRETVLLVEDEESLRSLIRRMLSMKGYTVLEAANVVEAIRLGEQHPGGIDLLLADVIMPEMSGPELAEILAGHQPNAQVLFMSGYPGGAVVHHRILEPGIPFLPKPFTPATLAQKIREVLDAKKRW